MRYCGYPERILSLSKESRRVMLRRISLAEEFEDTTGVSPWSFIKDFLRDSFAGNLRVFRGGQVINANNKKSEQIDIVLCSQNSIKIFSEKGFYPIETVFGVVNIKKELTRTNLFSNKKKDCGAIKNLKSIPKDNIRLNPGLLNQRVVNENFKKRFPCKIIFAYEGKILPTWEDELNKIVKEEPGEIDYLPDIIVVNKQGMIKKSSDGKVVLSNGKTLEKHFHFSEFEKNEMYHMPFLHILSELYKNANWQYYIGPKYEDYFNKDLS